MSLRDLSFKLILTFVRKKKNNVYSTFDRFYRPSVIVCTVPTFQRSKIIRGKFER